MGKPTGFIEYRREVEGELAPLDRIHNWDEFHLSMPDDKLRNQGARCMDCGTPFCHTGTLIAGMASGCPINNLIPEWNDLVYRGLWREALDRLHKTNNFPEFTGRVCPAPCEGSCVLGIHNPPVTIKSIEHSIVDKGWSEGWIVPHPPAKRTGKKVAIVGSGPAGLCAAAQLNQAGHWVTVLERADRPGWTVDVRHPQYGSSKKSKSSSGGLNYLKPKALLSSAISKLVKILSAADLRQDYDAVILCTGATKPRDLQIAGREFKGIHFAMDFLTANTQSVLDGSENSNFISAAGKDVIIIGGGDTGTDCVGTSIRHGCNSVEQLEIMPTPPLKRAADNPWPEWPKVYKMDYGQQEAAAKFGADPRAYLTTATKFEGDPDGNVTAVHTVQVQWERKRTGTICPQTCPRVPKKSTPPNSSSSQWDSSAPNSPLSDALSLEKDPRSNIKAEHEKYTTTIPGVFAAGDCRRGQSLVVWAFNEGRGAARECDLYLMGSTDLP